ASVCWTCGSSAATAGAAAAASRPPSRASATARVTTRAAAPTIAPTCRFPLVFLTVFLLEPVSRLVLLASCPEATTAKLGPRYPGYGGALVSVRDRCLARATPAVLRARDPERAAAGASIRPWSDGARAPLTACARCCAGRRATRST